jgi:hypothetical protein
LKPLNSWKRSILKSQSLLGLDATREFILYIYIYVKIDQLL